VNKRVCVILFMSLLMVFALNTAALADTGYQPSQNIYVNLSGPVSAPSTGTDLASTTFQTQEGVYQSTGLTVQHSYVVVCYNGVCAYIDPPVAMN